MLFVTAANGVDRRNEHILNGAKLDISIEYCKSKDVKKTIKVTGLAAKTTKDSIINYFENERRSGGGEVESVDFQIDRGMAFVTFSDANGRCFKVLLRSNCRIPFICG